MSGQRLLLRLSAIFVWLCLLVVSGPALAQAPTPIQIGQNAAGQLTAEVGAAQFTLASTGGETATIQVLGFGGFVPRFRVLNPAGIEILTVPNPGGQPTLTASAAFADAGSYTLEVQGENGSVGQFALSLQPGAPLPAAVELAASQPILALVGSQSPVQVYHFRTTSVDSADALRLTILSETPNAGALITLYNEDAARTIATSDAGVFGVTYQLPAQELGYRVEVRAGDSGGDVAFAICLGACAGLPGASAPVVPTPIPAVPTINVPVGCAAASSTGVTVNLRSGPGTQYVILSPLTAGQAYPVVGRWTGGDWYQLNVSGQPRWAAGSVIRLDGDCSALPFVDAPANAPLIPTNPPTATPAPPTVTPTPEPPKLPDLITGNIAMAVGVQSFASGTVSVINVGEGASGPYTVIICYDGICPGALGPFPGLPPQGVNTIMASGPVQPFPLGLPHNIVITVDPDNQVKESNEDNNVIGIPIA